MKKLVFGVSMVLVFLASLIWFVGRGGRPSQGPQQGSNLPVTDEDEIKKFSSDVVHESGLAGQRAVLEEVLLQDPTEAGPSIHGRIEFPPGSPPDSTMVVHAYGAASDFHWKRNFPQQGEAQATVEHYLERGGKTPVATASVAGDGRFSFGVHGLPPAVWLVVDGLYLYGEHPIEWRLEDALKVETPIVLRPELGGAVVGTLGTADGLLPEEGLVGLRYDRSAGIEQGDMYSSDIDIRIQRCAQDGSFVVRGLTPGLRVLVGRAKGFALREFGGVPVRMGQTSEVDLALNRGVTLRGSVTRGEWPVDGAVVSAIMAESATRFLNPWGFLGAHSLSRTDGSFEILNVTSVPLKVSAHLNGPSSVAEIEGPMVEGQVLAGIALHFEGMMTISGTAYDPNEKLVAGIRLVQHQRRGARWLPMHLDGETDDQGAFRLLCEAKHSRIRIDATQYDDAGVVVARGYRADLKPGDKRVQMDLYSTVTLPGTVMDESGRPLQNAKVSFISRGEVPWHSSASTDEDGQFQLSGMLQGVGTYHARLDGYVPGTLEHLIPSSDVPEPLRFVLSPSPLSKLAGRVVTPEGDPVAGALVTDDSDQGVFNFHLASIGSTEVADALGQFKLRGPGRVSAWAKGYAPSRPVAIVSEGALQTLRLRNGGSLRCRVINHEGGAAHHYVVRLHHISEMFVHILATNENGVLDVDEMAPGNWLVEAFPMIGVGAHEEEPEINDAFAWSKKLLVRDRLSIVEGELTEIVLGSAGDTKVVVHGSLVAGGQPTKGQVFFLEDGIPSNFAKTLARTNDLGGFEIVLPRSGRYTVVAMGEEFGRSATKVVEIPSLPELTLEVELPVGGVVVRVLGVDGFPSPNRNVHLMRPDGMTESLVKTMLHQRSPSDAQGKVLFGGLDPGTYMAVLDPPIAAPVVFSVKESLEEIDLQCQATGQVQLQFEASDNKLPDSLMLFVRFADGAWAAPPIRVRKASEGYRLELAPGTYTLYAASLDVAIPERVTLSIEEGQSLQRTLQLKPATFVTLEVQGAQDVGELKLQVKDQAGRPWAGTLAPEGEGSALRLVEGLRPNLFYLGPLPLGVYQAKFQSGSQNGSLDFEVDGKLSRLDLTLKLR